MRNSFLLCASAALAACNFAATGSDAASQDDAATTPPTAAPSSPSAPGASQAAEPLTPTGWGPLTIGMDRAAIEQALGADVNPESVAGPDDTQCDQLHPARAPEGMLLMVEQDRLSRIELHDGSMVKTADDFGVGDRSSAIKQALDDRVQASPHKYADAPAEYLTLWEGGKATGPGGYVSDEAARGITYEIGTDGKVQSIFAGGPAIQYVEGCL